MSDLTLQLVLKRLMHTVVKQMTTSPSTSIRCTPHCLTNREGNAVRYMAGYVVMKLRKKYRKHHLYARVLDTLKTNLDESSVVSLDDYTHVWVEQRDRGGLCHVSDDLFSFTKKIELVCRKYLDIRAQPTENILSKIEEDALNTESITRLWNVMASSIPGMPERIGLLKAVIKLWSTIRVHSFAEGWTDKFKRVIKRLLEKLLNNVELKRSQHNNYNELNTSFV